MGRLLNDSQIKLSEAINDYRKLLMCHNSWVDLYSVFMDDPCLKDFYEKACQKHPEAVEQDSKVFLMKQTVFMMAEYITNQQVGQKGETI